MSLSNIVLSAPSSLENKKRSVSKLPNQQLAAGNSNVDVTSSLELASGGTRQTRDTGTATSKGALGPHLTSAVPAVSHSNNVTNKQRPASRNSQLPEDIAEIETNKKSEAKILF
jgi:hypothetical protein